jgi:hypothetical protein
MVIAGMTFMTIIPLISGLAAGIFRGLAGQSRIKNSRCRRHSTYGGRVDSRGVRYLGQDYLGSLALILSVDL